MTRIRSFITSVFMLSAASGFAAAEESADPTPIFDIPRIESIAIDGNGADWGGQGLIVGPLLTLDDDMRPVTNYDSQFRLGWDEKGLLFLGQVQDDHIEESVDASIIGSRDAIELFLGERRASAGEFVQFQVGTGADPRFPAIRTTSFDYRKDKDTLPKPSIEVSGKPVPGGYVLEARLPWSNLPNVPKMGSIVAAQVWMTDSDKPGDWFRTMWYPANFNGSHTMHLYRVRLAKTASPPTGARVRVDYDAVQMTPRITILGRGMIVGKPLVVKDGNTVLARSVIDTNSPRMAAVMVLPLPAEGKPYKNLEVTLGGEHLTTASFPQSGRLIAIHRFQQRIPEITKAFGLDRPWDDMATAPALIRKHRGLAAAAIAWFEKKPWATADDQVSSLGEMVGAMEALDGKDYLAARRGSFWSAYYSPADGAGCYFVVTLPPDFSSRKTYPLVVDIHGATGRPMPSKAPYPFPYLHVQPYGRGDTGYRALGEVDVLAVMDYMRQWYKVDDSRIYITGGSMGGSGTWLLASHYPDLFAAAAPICGSSDGHPLKNLRNVPVWNHHGDADWVVPLDLSRYGVDYLQRAGYPVLHTEYPGLGHAGLPAYKVQDWLLQFRRPESPAVVSFTCQTPREGKAYWTRVRRMADPHLPSELDAVVIGKGPLQAISLVARNISVLELDLTKAPVDRRADLQLQVGERHFTNSAPLPERLYVCWNDTAVGVTNAWSPPSSPRRTYQAGASADLYAGEPLLIVTPTLCGKERTGIYEQAAALLAVCGGRMVVGKIPVRADTDVSDLDLQRYNLILLGGPKENKISAAIVPKLPLSITEKNELMAGNREPVSLDGAALRLACYNPLAPQRLIFLMASDVGDIDLAAWLKDAQRLMTGSGGWARIDMPDLLVNSIVSVSNGVQVADRRQMQFTHDWQWRQPELPATLAPEAFSGQLQMTLAMLRAMRRTAGTDFAMGWGPEPGEKAYDPRWFTLADLATMHVPIQTLVCRLSGDELIDLNKRWLTKGEVVAAPAFEPASIDTQRLYRVAMPPDLCWKLKEREKNLRDVQAGPDCRPQDLWAEVIGP